MKRESLCLHAGHEPDSDTHSRAVPIYRTSAFTFDSTEHAANLFALRELGNIYTRLMNPTTAVLESRVAQLEGAHPMAGLAVASGTSAIFYAIINLAEAGDNIISARNLYGGSYTQFNDILPALGIEVRLVDSNDPAAFEAAADDKTRAFFCETVPTRPAKLPISKPSPDTPKIVASRSSSTPLFDPAPDPTTRSRCRHRRALAD